VVGLRAPRVGALPLNTQPSSMHSFLRLSISLSIRLFWRRCIGPRIAHRKVRAPLAGETSAVSFTYHYPHLLPATVTGTYYHYRFLTSDFCVSDFLTAPFFNKPLCIGPLFSNPTLHYVFSSLLLHCGRNDRAYLGSNREPWWLAAFKCTRSDGRYHDWRLSLKVCPCARTTPHSSWQIKCIRVIHTLAQIPTSHSSRYRGPRRAASR